MSSESLFLCEANLSKIAPVQRQSVWAWVVSTAADKSTLMVSGDLTIFVGPCPTFVRESVNRLDFAVQSRAEASVEDVANAGMFVVYLEVSVEGLLISASDGEILSFQSSRLVVERLRDVAVLNGVPASAFECDDLFSD